jgi:hypothetical protein
VTVDRQRKAFFADQSVLTQIDNMHNLWFKYIDEYSEELQHKLLKAVDNIAKRYRANWKRIDDKGFPNSGQHHGIAPIDPKAFNGVDVCVHVGWDPNDFWSDAWVGVLSRHNDAEFAEKLKRFINGTFSRSESSFLYPIYVQVEGWPRELPKGWESRIESASRFSSYADVLSPKFITKTVGWVETHLDMLVNKLDLLLPHPCHGITKP